MDEDTKMTVTPIIEENGDRPRDRDDAGERSSKRDRRSRSRSRSRSPRRPRRRSYSRSRSRSPGYRDRDRGHRSSRRGGDRSRSRDRDRDGHKRSSRGGDGGPFSRSVGGPINAPHEEAVEFAKVSKRENRVYVGNLSYDVKYGDLLQFMRGAGEVLFAEVLVTPTGVSKGCGIVEFSDRDSVQRAMKELAETPLLGRPIFIREDREAESRFGATPVPGKMGMALAQGGGFGGHNAYGGPRPPPAQSSGNQLYVGNLPYQAGWQDLKDLFRSAGNIIRADINMGPDGRAKGSGTVVFETSKDAQSAITMYHGFEWYGRTLEVREDRYAGLTGSRGRGLGGPRGGFGGRGGPGGRGGFGRGGPRGGGPGGDSRQFSDDIYAPYDGPNGTSGRGDSSNTSGYPTGPSHGTSGPRAGPVSGPPSQQIMVRNLPWSTANEDLIDLFETTGTVEVAEILFSGTRSLGSGVVQFTSTEEAETAIAKFQGYVYGGRPLDVRFNDRWHDFTSTAAKGTHLQTAS